MGVVTQDGPSTDVAGREPWGAEVGPRDGVPHELAVEPPRELPDAVSLGHPTSVTGGCDSRSADTDDQVADALPGAIGVLEPEVVAHAGEAA